MEPLLTEAAMPTLQDVVLVAVTDSIPEASAHWPVRVLRAADCPRGVPNAYFCGRVGDVQRVLEQVKERPLGLILDVLDASSSEPIVEVVPALGNGFTASAWEGAVAAVCSRHLETVQGMILRHAKTTPDKVALIFEDNKWSFQQLLSRAHSLVAHLQAMGIDPNRGTVAVQLAQSDICITCYLGLYQARYQVHVMDNHAAGRAYRLSVCSSQALLCESTCSLDGLDGVNLQTVFVDKLELEYSTPIDKVVVEGELEDTLFIEYTSGSTGRAKSVATKQWRLAHWIRWHEFHFPLLPGNDVVAYNLFFIWYWQISLCQGGTTVVYPTAMNHDVSALMPYFERHGVHRVNCLTPGLISALLEVQDSLPASLRLMLSGGEALPMATCREWLRRWPHVELMNNYALTEAAADMGFCRITPEVIAMDMLYAPISDGIIAWNNECEIVDGELVIHGWNVADGYLPPTESNAFTVSQACWRNTYRTGDRASWIDGKLFLMGRMDSVVKVRGHRVDLTGLEAQVGECTAVKDVAMVSWSESVWGVVVTEDLPAVQRHAEEQLPQAHLIVWQQWTELPYTKSGKRDRPRIVQMLKESLGTEVDITAAAANLPGGPPVSAEERTVAEAWAAVLGRAVGREERFQQAGGHSLAAMKLAKRLGLSPAEVFAYPTVSAMAARLAQADAKSAALPATLGPLHSPGGAVGRRVAVVGIAGRFPGAPSAAALWEGLRAGRDLLTTLPARPGFVPRKGVVPDLGLDCAFWGIPKEVALGMDTAQRTLLEVAYEALADAGLDPLAVEGRVGVVVCGGSLPHYGEDVLGTKLEECRTERPDEYFALEIGMDKDYLASQISYKLNLHGPSEVVQTACSSGLVAIVRAMHMLRLGLCDYVVCGGASFSPDAPVRKVDGMIWSPDGICRPFAEGSNGTVNADGAGLVVLTSLDAAQARGQRVYAAVLGGATNNDGARKAGFSAPSHQGQVEVIHTAHADAGITGDAVDYVEAHGTGTQLGDPLEAQALAEALRTDRKVMLGSVKGNIGHMNTVAGTSGFIKAALMLHHQHMVASLHSESPSRFIDWGKTPLTLAQEAGPWKGAVAGVSSFGIGGTNAHVVLGAVQATSAGTSPESRPPLAQAKVHSFKRDALVSEHKVKTRRLEASADFAFSPPRRLTSKAGAAVADRGHADPCANFFYKTEYEHVEVSCLRVAEAAVILDGDVLPTDLPSQSVIATPSCALTAARACGGCLLYVGNSDKLPTADDESQEELLMGAASLIESLARAPKDGIEVFFILKSNLRYAALWGLLRVAAREHPELRLRRLLREEGAPLLLPAMPTELLLRRDGAYAARLRPAAPPSATASAPPAHRRALVTGGLRGLGFKVAEWLAATGRAKALVLAGRNEPRGEVAEALVTLRALVPTEVHLCDVSNWTEVEKMPDDIDLVVHCAGNVKDGLLLRLTPEDARDVLRPKIRGTLHLKERYPDAHLLVFSSSSGLFGPVGQATYAAANTFVDALAPSVQWGGWADVGMAKDLGMTPLPGERFLPVDVGLDCLGRLLDAPADRDPFCVLDADWESYRSNAAVFAPDDALLADIERPLLQDSILGARRDFADAGVRCWELVLGPAGSRWHGSCAFWEVCQQHVVEGTPIFPGTAYITLALAAAKEALDLASATLHDVAFLRPLELTAPRRLSVLLTGGATGGSLRFTSRPLQDGPAVLHCTCSVSPAKDLHVAAIPTAELPSMSGLYDQFSAAGFRYGPSFQAVSFAGDAARASCELLQFPDAPCPIHPATLDTALHLAALLHPLGVQGVPQAIRRLRFHAGTTPARAAARLVKDQLEFQVLDSAGKVVCQIEGLGLAALEAPPRLQLRRRSWRPVPPEPRGTWLAVGEEAAQLGLPELTSRDGEAHTATVLAVRASTLQDVLRCREEARRLAAKEPCVVLALEAPLAEAAARAAAEVGARAVLGSAEDLRRMSAGLGAAGAPLLRIKDGQLLAESLAGVEQPPSSTAPSSEPFTVVLDQSRAAQGARCRLSRRRAVAAHEVELRTSIWALNFRDVLVAVGAMSSEVAGKSLGIGGECFGEVVSVGSDVSGLAVGDRVIAVPPDGMGSYANIDARWVSRAPEGMTPEEAVSGTCAYGTAWLGLHWMARIAKGDRVLIHSAAGGIGLAAVHLCLREGCVVYATASTPEKRALLTSLGAIAVFDSRNVPAFEQGIRDATDGEGVDVVLNSLSGDAITTSMQLLRPFGRFIELGKRDQYEDTRLGLAPFLGGLTYAAAHFDVLMLRHPDRCRKLLEEVWRELPSLPRLPFTSFSMTELPKALEYFSKGIHVGKVLVTVQEDTPVLPAFPAALAGPQKDIVVEALRMSTDAKDGSGGMVCVPRLEALDSLEMLKGAQVVITASAAVCALAKVVCPEALCVQLPRWEPISGIDDWLKLGGHLVAVEEEHGGDLRQWLMEVTSEMVGPLDMDETFERSGFDSLMLISLARRLSAKVGKAVSVADLYDHPTPQKLLDSLSGGPQPEILRAKAVCLHGFRSNKDAMALQLAPFISALGLVEWVFINSPRKASGPSDPKIPRAEAFEWWGQQDGPYETGWMAPHFDGLRDTLPAVESLAPVGAVGFSQGAAVATLLKCKWVALFSAVVPPGLDSRGVPSFHCFDPAEDFARQCVEVGGYFSAKEVHKHNRGHNVPHEEDIIRHFVDFVSRQLALAN